MLQVSAGLVDELDFWANTEPSGASCQLILAVLYGLADKEHHLQERD